MLAIYSVLAFAVAALAAPQAPVLGVTVTANPGASASATSVGPNPSGVYINSISYGGTGCPQGTVGQFVSADRFT